MSVSLMAVVWTLDVPRHIQSFLLALADHASDDGSNIFPSVSYLSWKTSYSERQVQRLIKSLLEDRVLEIRVLATHTFPNQYQMNLDVCPKKKPFVRGRKKSPQQVGDKSSGVGVTKMLDKGDTIASPKPLQEPSIEPPPQVYARVIDETLHIPSHISRAIRVEIVRKLEKFDFEDRQLLMDELTGRMAINKINNPIGYLNSLIRKFVVGEFTPELAQQVKANREALQSREQLNEKIEEKIQSKLNFDKSSPTKDFKELLAKMKKQKPT